MKKIGGIWKETKYWWLIAINIIYPLMMTDKYFNITRTKVITYGIIVVFFAIASLYDEIQTRMKERQFAGLKTMDYLVLLFLVFNIVSALTADSKYDSFLASRDKNMGLFFVMALVCTYLIMRLESWNMSVVCNMIGAGAILVTLFSMIQYLGFDLFYLFDGIRSDITINFISPLGNTAVYGRYLILVYPVVISRMIFEIDGNPVMGYLGAFLFGPAVLVANVDAGWLGFFVAAGMFTVISGKRLKTFAACVKMYALICAGLGIWGLLYLGMPHPRNTSRIARFFITHWYVEILLAVALLGVFLWLRKKQDRPLAVGKIVLWIGIFLAIVVLGSFVYFSVFDRQTPLGRLENYIRFSHTWGTERGYIWNWCMELYQDFSPKEKFWGKGQGMVPVLLDRYYTEIMRQKIGYIFDNAHSLYLQLLLSIGVLGVLSYIGVIATAVVKSLKEERYYGAGIALFACALIDMVCICEPITAPWAWLLIGLIASRKPEENCFGEIFVTVQPSG